MKYVFGVTNLPTADMMDGKVALKLGHYDSTQTFIADSIYDTKQYVTNELKTQGQYGPEPQVQHSFEIWKPNPNENKIYVTVERAYSTWMNKDLVEVTGAINGYLAPYGVNDWFNVSPPTHPTSTGYINMTTGCSGGQWTLTYNGQAQIPVHKTLKLP